MARQRLKLKQASAVLQVQPRELQNLVQFGVVKPQRSAGTYFFDMRVLLAAKVALYLKESMGTRTSVLSKLMDAFSASEEKFWKCSPNSKLRRNLRANAETVCLPTPDTYISSVRELSL